MPKIPTKFSVKVWFLAYSNEKYVLNLDNCCKKNTTYGENETYIGKEVGKQGSDVV